MGRSRGRRGGEGDVEDEAEELRATMTSSDGVLVRRRGGLRAAADAGVVVGGVAPIQIQQGGMRGVGVWVVAV